MAPDTTTSSPARRDVGDAEQAADARGPGESVGLLVSVYGPRPDVGVAKVASALATAFLSLDRGRVALAELDPRVVRARSAVPAPPAGADDSDATLPRSGDRTLRTPPDRLDPTGGGGDDERVMIPGTDAGLARRADGLWVLAPGRRRTPALSDAKAVTVALDAMRQAFGVCVAELEHQVNERTLSALDAADRIVVVTEGSVPALRGTQRVLRLCRRLNYPDEKMCVVVHQHDAPGTLAVADIATILKREIFWKVIPDDPNDVAGLAGKLAGVA